MPLKLNPLTGKLDLVNTSTGGGGSTVPGGNPSQIQYNNAGAFGGVTPLTYDGTALTASRLYFNGTSYVDGSLLAGNAVFVGGILGNGQMRVDTGVKTGAGSSTGTDPLSGYVNGFNSASTSAPAFGVKVPSGATGDIQRWINNSTIVAKITAAGTGSFQGLMAVVTTKTANYTVATSDRTVLCNSATGFTVTLPDATTVAGATNSYPEIVIKNINTGSITVATSSSQTIDGVTTYTLGSQYKYVTVTTNGANWFVVGNN